MVEFMVMDGLPIEMILHQRDLHKYAEVFLPSSQTRAAWVAVVDTGPPPRYSMQIGYTTFHVPKDAPRLNPIPHR